MVCECGCGLEVTPGRRFVMGHNQRGTHHNRPGPMVGRRHSAESRQKMSIAKTGIRLPPQSPEVRAKHGDALRGRPKSGTHRLKLAEAGRVEGETWNSGGRALLYRPDHPTANKHGRVLRARLIVEEKLGRFLSAGEIAHHVNFDCTDDHPDNLMAMARHTHTALHHRIRQLGIEDHFTLWFSQAERELHAA